MKKSDHILRMLNSILGFLSIGIFLFAITVLVNLRPKMLMFEPLTRLEENLLTGVGLGLILVLGYFLLSLLQIVRLVRGADSLRVLPLVLIVLGVIGTLFVFSDVALLSDIANQYQDGLDQPEWSLLFPIMGGQFLLAVTLAFLHVSGFFLKLAQKPVARDINIFLVVQVVGVVTGLMGLGLTSLGFFYPRAWSLPVHTIIGSLILIFPYGLAVIYWGFLKLREKDRVWWDEKQSQDVGRSAMITLALDSLLLMGLFVLNSQNLDGVIRLLWLPLYIFGTVTFFSVSYLYFSNRG